jgi:hypothetical protein
MKDGFIILKINNKEVTNVDDLKAMISNTKNFTISGFYPGFDGLYEYPVNIDNND